MDPNSSPERLSPLDASFLYLERPTELLHVGALAVLAAAPPIERLIATLDERLGRLPRYRQVPRRPLLDWHLPEWRDAVDFDVRRHVHRIVLDAPGNDTALHAAVDAAFARQLPEDRPRWECHLIEGLSGDRAALLLKVHHCMIDGVSGVQVLDALTGADSTVPSAASGPASGPSWLATTVDAVAHPRRTLGLVKQTIEAGGALAALALGEAAAFPWNGPIGPGRAVRWQSLDLDRMLAMRGAAACKVNDVALAIIAGALRALFTPNGTGHRARALVPVSLRRPDEHLKLGNRISGHLVSLPLDVAEPRERLRLIASEMRTQKAGVPPFDVALAVASALPASVAPWLVHVNDRRPIVHTVCTNVPGPSDPRTLAGEGVLAVHPIVPLAAGVGLGFAMLSYAGTFSIVATADPALVPMIDRIPAAVAAAEEELAASLGIASPACSSPRTAAPTVGDIMTGAAATVAPDTRLLDVLTLMRTRRIRHVPVVDGAGCLRGLVTHRDVLAALPSSLGIEGETTATLAFDWAEARDFMETHLSTAVPSEPAHAAGRRMARQKIGCLPVVGARGELVGIVTEADFLRWATDHMAP